MMLRECCRHEELTKIILSAEQFYKFFTYVELSTFDIASDAFLTFRVSLKLTSFVFDLFLNF
jgi:calcium binding protein 39